MRFINTAISTPSPWYLQRLRHLAVSCMCEIVVTINFCGATCILLHRWWEIKSSITSPWSWATRNKNTVQLLWYNQTHRWTSRSNITCSNYQLMMNPSQSFWKVWKICSLQISFSWKAVKIISSALYYRNLSYRWFRKYLHHHTVSSRQILANIFAT